MNQEAKKADLLYGAPAIAAYMDVTERQVRHLMEKGKLPSFSIEGKVCASRSSVDAWIEEKRAEGRRASRKERAAAAGK